MHKLVSQKVKELTYGDRASSEWSLDLNLFLSKPEPFQPASFLEELSLVAPGQFLPVD